MVSVEYLGFEQERNHADGVITALQDGGWGAVEAPL